MKGLVLRIPSLEPYVTEHDAFLQRTSTAIFRLCIIRREKNSFIPHVQRFIALIKIDGGMRDVLSHKQC